MDYYINLQFRADEDIPLYFIRNKTFTKLHKALHDQKQTSIGASFPGYKIKLGDVIRLHGDSAKWTQNAEDVKQIGQLTYGHSLFVSTNNILWGAGNRDDGQLGPPASGLSNLFIEVWDGLE